MTPRFAFLLNFREHTPITGFREVQFDAGKLASGVYFYRLQAGLYTATRAMIVVK